MINSSDMCQQLINRLWLDNKFEKWVRKIYKNMLSRDQCISAIDYLYTIQNKKSKLNSSSFEFWCLRALKKSGLVRAKISNKSISCCHCYPRECPDKFCCSDQCRYCDLGSEWSRYHDCSKMARIRLKNRRRWKCSNKCCIKFPFRPWRPKYVTISDLIFVDTPRV